MLPRRPVPRPRALVAGLLAAGALSLGLGAGPATPTADARSTVCGDVVPTATAQREVRAKGRLLGRVWIHLRRNGTSCIVLRAVAYKGTPHYMSLQVCQVSGRPYRSCTGADAGRYRYYAGPIDYPMGACQAIRVKIDVPNGRRLTDQWVYGACD